MSPTSFATADVHWYVKPGVEAAFEEIVQGTLRAASAFPGFAGGNIGQPAPGTSGGEWQLVLHFAQPAQLQAWQASAVCRAWKASSDALAVGAARVQQVSGLETWFTRPHQGTAPAPPNWKMALVTFVGIYPLIMLVPRLLGPVSHSWPLWLTNLVVTAILIALITWLVMPALTSVLKGWLYPRGAAPPAAPT